MTANQALRQERRRRRRQQEQRLAAETIAALLAMTILIIAAFNIIRLTQCGMTSQEVEAAELARWEERGITISRW